METLLERAVQTEPVQLPSRMGRNWWRMPSSTCPLVVVEELEVRKLQNWIQPRG